MLVSFSLINGIVSLDDALISVTVETLYYIRSSNMYRVSCMGIRARLRNTLDSIQARNCHNVRFSRYGIVEGEGTLSSCEL